MFTATHAPILKYTHTHTHTHTHIYIYIFTNQLSTSIHGTRKKTKNPWPGTREKNISNHGPEEKEKSFLG